VIFCDKEIKALAPTIPPGLPIVHSIVVIHIPLFVVIIAFQQNLGQLLLGGVIPSNPWPPQILITPTPLYQKRQDRLSLLGHDRHSADSLFPLFRGTAHLSSTSEDSYGVSCALDTRPFADVSGYLTGHRTSSEKH
jgi:hypothetical protein